MNSLHLLLLVYSLFQHTTCISSSISALNEYKTDGDVYWESTSYFKPSVGAKYERLKRRKSLYFALKFQYYGKQLWGKWENILRIGNYGNASSFDCDEHGNRYPGLNILPSSNGLQIALSNESDCWTVIESNYNLIENIIYSLIIEYNETHSTVSISTYNATTNQIIKPLHLISNNSRINDNTLLGHDQYMDIIISDPLATPANVILFDMIIISYDDTLTFPTESPTKAPTKTVTRSPTLAPVIARDITILMVTILMDYNASNSANKTENNEVIRDITEDIINNYINNTIIHVIISNIENKEYDIVLISNYTTDSKDIAIQLEVLFENQLETELLNTFKRKNNSIIIGEIDIEIIVINHNNETQIYTTSETTLTNILLVSTKNKNNISLIWIIVIIACFIMVCIFMIGFYIGRYKSIKPGQLRIHAQSNVLNEYDIGNGSGNIQKDCKLTQNSDNENDYSEPAQIGHIMAIESTNDNDRDIINNIRNDIFEIAMGAVTPVGMKTKINRNNSTSELQIVDNINNIQLNKLNEDEDDDLDIEDMYNYQTTKGNNMPENNTNITEGHSVDAITQ